MAEKKKTEKSKSSAGKKPVKKAPADRRSAVKKGAQKRKPKGKAPQRNSFNPAYVLTIMLLLTVIALLVNNIYFSTDKGAAVSDRKSVTGENTVKQIPGKRELKPETVQNDEKEPVGTAGKSIRARIYFVKFNEKTEKSYMAYVNRNVEGGKAVENSIKQLIKGLTPGEERRGLHTAVPGSLKLRSVKLRNRTAELDFDPSIQWGATGQILLNRIDQIVYTATQFDDVDSVLIKINGRTRKTLGGDGLSISGPLQRRVN